MPTSRYNRTFRYGGFSAGSTSQLYGRGVAGNTTTTVSTRGLPGRETPLYVGVRQALTEAHVGDIAAAGYTFDATNTNVIHLNPIALGDGLTERHANRVFMTQLQIRGALSVGASSLFNSGTMLIVYDRQPAGALPVITDILDTAGITSFQNLSTRDRFSILWRHDFALEGTAAVPTADSTRRIDKVLLLNKYAAYTVGTTSGAIANVKSGGLYFVWFGNGAAATALVGALGFRLVFSP